MPKIEINTNKLSSSELRQLKDDMLSWADRIGSKPGITNEYGDDGDIKDLIDAANEISEELSARGETP